MRKNIFLTGIIVLGFTFTLNAAITVNINSGNPVMPFPQFINYANGIKSLADSSVQPDGVSHAEMEQWLRDAWKIHSNELNYAGAIPYAAGIQYIVDTSTPYCSEGHGYALLGAALMCDKNAFDGLWFYLNENNYFNKTKKYSTGVVVNAAYKYGAHAPSVYGAGSDTAADGDMDIAIAALIAWKQWGDDTGYYAPGGTGAAGGGGFMIQYKQMALDMMRFMVEKDEGDNTGDDQWTSGDIGFDGYPRGGNTGGGFGGETTGWGTTTGLALYGARPQFAGPSENYFDYWGSGYLNAFACALSANNDSRDVTPGTGGWSNVNQYLRASAADAWLQNQLATNHIYPVVGIYSVDAASNTASFRRFNEGEDFRSIWRKAIDNLWFGDPTQTWNPVTHQPVAGANTYHYNAAVKFYDFFENNIPCKKWANAGPVSYSGAAGASSDYSMDGAPLGAFHLNWIFGTGAAAILTGSRAHNDYTIAGDFFREAMILWDSVGGTDYYLNSIPHYFHGIFRQLGLVVLTGNAFNPCTIASTANMKVYKSINKTYSFAGDVLTYRINYRNYGHTAATGVYIRDTLPSYFTFVSSTPAATSLGGNVYEWGPFTVTGMANQNIAPTLGGVTLVVRIADTAPNTKFCNTTDIRCANGTGWRSNDIPNNISDVNETNCVDIVPAALTITKTANTHLVNGGDTITYTIQYCNSSTAGWINGGRSGVNFSFGVEVTEGIPGTASPALTFLMRGNHAAAEPVINWANYRISYFLNSAYHGAAWTVALDYCSGFPAGSQIVTTEDLVPGSDAYGSWNQRIMLQFGQARTIPTHQILNVAGSPSLIHMGDTLTPFIIKGRITASYNNQDWTDDWSQQDAAALATQDDALLPISPDWTKGDGSSTVVNKINKHACETAPANIGNILIEEWDGYTWRRVFGNGPQPGRQVNNVEVIDTLPVQVTWGNWIGTAGVKTGNTLQWDTASMLVSECKTASYWVTANTIGCPGLDQYANNIAFVQADNEFPVSDSERVTITCAAVPTPTPAPASLTKTANASTYNNGDAITYTINYSNTYGSITNDPLTSATTWTNRTTATSMTVGSGRVTSVANQNTVMTNNTSNGTNGVIIARVHVQSYAVFGICVRHTGVTGIGNGVYVTFKPNAPSNGEVRFWNGTTQVGTTQSFMLNTDFDLKIVLNGGTIVCYIDNTLTQSFEGFTTPVSMAGMTVQNGYAGVINGTPTNVDTYGTNYISSWHTELDTAYNTLIIDTVPAGVSYVGGDNGAALGGGIVSWPTIAVMNLNQSVSYHWWGTISGNCQNVTNTVRVFPQGITTPIMAATIVRVNCGLTTPTFTPSRTRTPTPSPSGTGTRTATATYSPSGTPSRSATPSPSPTGSGTVTFTQTRTGTPTLTRTPTGSPSPSPSQTFTFTRTPTPSITNSPSPTGSASFTPTYTGTRTNTPSASATPTGTQTATPTRTATLTFTRTATQTITDTISSNTPTITRTITWTPTATLTFTGTGTTTSTPTDTGTRTASPTASATPSPTGSGTHTPTATPTRTASPANSATDTPTVTPTQTATPTRTDTNTPLPTASFTDTISSNTPTVTRTSSDTPTHTPTASGTPTGTTTRTATNTATESHTASPAATPSITPTATGTRTATQTATETATFTETRSPTFTPTFTRTATETATPTATRTDTPTPTDTRTMTDTPTYTNTQTETSTPTETPTITATASITPTPLPSPSDIDITLEAEGPIKPKIGDTVVLTITLTNNTDADVYGIAVRALLPNEVAYLGTDFLDAPVSITPTAAGTTLAWDITYKLGETDPFILEPGQSETITFSVKIIAATVNNDPIRITAETDYMDGYYFTGSPNGDRHPPLSTGDFFYPLGRIVVYPNPYNPLNGDLKFVNVVPGSTIQIWTLSGEFVRTIYAPTYRAFWDGRNHKATEVSAGIYLFTIRNATSATPLKGKIFVIKQ